METAKYRAFLTAIEKGTFSKAADQMRYTPAGVQQLVTALEQELGLTLLNRSNKGVTLNKDGERMLPLIKDLLRQESQIQEMASAINGLLVGSISIASYFSVATHWLPGLIADFQRMHPNIEFHIMEGPRQVVLNRLQDKSADIGFATCIEPMKMEWIPLHVDPILAIIPKDHPLASEAAFPLERCGEEPFIMAANANDEDLMRIFRENQIVPNVRYSTINHFSAINMVAHGLGISMMNELITGKFDAEVVKLPLDPPQFITLGIIVPSVRKARPAIKQFVQYAEKQLKKEALPATQ